MGTDKRVQILLSTYNGEKYLREQLESIIAQTAFNQCLILIRDDGSTDGTQAILEEYELRDSFIVVYGKNTGVNASYIWLLEHADVSCEYIALCDQDDVWLPEKIEKSLSMLDGLNCNRPLLFGSGTKVVDASLEELPRQLNSEQYRISYYNAMIQNVLPGHTQMMNRRLLDLALARGFSDVHVIDWWFYLLASGTGEIAFFPGATVLHRQHGKNAVGMRTGRLISFRRKLRYIREGRGNAFSKQLFAFYCRYQSDLSEEYRNETERFFGSMECFASRLRYILGCKAYRQKKTDTWLFKILYLLGKYKL